MWLICKLALWPSVSHVNKVCMYKIWYWREMQNKNVVVVVIPHIFPRDLDRSWQVPLDVCSSLSLVISVDTHHQFNFVCRYYFCIWPSSSGYRRKCVRSFFHSILGHDNGYHNIPVYNFFHDILDHSDYPNISVYNHQLCIRPFCNGCRCRFARSFFHGIHTH